MWTKTVYILENSKVLYEDSWSHDLATLKFSEIPSSFKRRVCFEASHLVRYTTNLVDGRNLVVDPPASH